jgi:Flp pilus assembly secretin CpaC
METLERETLMNRWMRKAFIFIFTFQLSSLPTLPLFSEAQAQTAIPTEIQVGRSQIISVKKPISKISVASQEIADVDVMSPTQVIIFGKSAGSTNLVVLDEAGQTSFFEVTVRPAIQSKQVLLQVKVAEVDRNGLKELGINFSTLQKDGSMLFGGADFAGKVSPPAVSTGTTGLAGESAASGLPALTLAESVSAAIFRLTPNNATTAVVKALSDKGLLTTLAEPNMVVRSGEKGHFLAGGRFPIPVIQGGGGGAGGVATVTVQYEQFGVRLDMSPVAFDDGRISLLIDPAEVSSLDYANAVTISGFNIPAVQTREVHTTVDLQENETLVLAGLIQNTESQNISKIPLLGDIPILGALFRSTRFQKNETELMIFITPKIIQPYAAGTQVAYPGKEPPSQEELKEFRWMPLLPGSVNPPK